MNRPPPNQAAKVSAAQLDNNLPRWSVSFSVKTLTALLLLAVAAQASVVRDLDSSQQASLEKGEVVLRSEDVGSVWPRLIVYVRVRAPVSAVERVFRDYAGASSYIPGLVSATVERQPDADTYEVCYINAMPIIGQSRSVVRNRYSRDGEALVVRWKLLEASHAEESTGELRVEPYCEETCVLRYSNLVKPKSSLAKLAKGAAAGEAKKTVLALKKESERRRG